MAGIFKDIDDEHAYRCILEARHELRMAVFHLENAIGHTYKNKARQMDIQDIRNATVMIIPRIEAMLTAMMDDEESV